MKRTYSLIFILSLSILLFTSLKCRKDKNEAPDTLPPITQTGANTFGCKVDGKIWVPYAKCGFGNNPCGELIVDIFKISQNQVPVGINIGPGKFENNLLSYFTISSPTNIGIYGIGDKIDSVEIKYIKPGSIEYFEIPGTGPANYFVITKLDTVNKIISGLFEATLYRSFTDSVKITDGRFDLKFSACRCSN